MDPPLRQAPLALVAVGLLGPLAMASVAGAEDHPVWDPDLAQAATGPYGTGSPPADVGELRGMVDSYTSLSDDQLRARIGTVRGGASTDEGRYDRAQATYNLALLYHLTGDSDAGRRSALLLERYAEVFPGWSYEVCSGQSSDSGEPCGVWTSWYHNDLDVAMLLALAFDLLAPAGVLGDRVTAIRELLVQIVQRDLEYRLYTFNWAFYRPLGLVVFGRVLDDPELAHLGYWFYSKHVHEYFAHDGFLREGTYSYHRQMTTRFVSGRQSFYLDGYSDPEGYVHEPFDRRWDPPRIDGFDTEATFGRAWARMRSSLQDTLLPNGHYPVLNDTKHYGYVSGDPPSASILLGGVGHAVLAGGVGEEQTQARLDFSATANHAHRDALHLIYFGDGAETVGGTAYRNPSREWNTSTLSQNLVVIDEVDQTLAGFNDWTMSPYVPGIGRVGPVRRTQWSESANKHNDVQLWEPHFEDFDAVQVVDVDATDAYRDHADLYRRALVMVRIEGDEYYVADIFRVRGGTQYDWLLHGGHDENVLEVGLGMSATTGVLGEIRFETAATTDGPWEATFDHGGTIGHVWMAGAPATTVHAGVGPRYEHGGEQDHLVVRRSASAAEEEVFLAVHEAHDDRPRVSSVDSLSFEGGSGTAVGMRVTLADGTVDYLVHTLDADPPYPTQRVAGVDLEVAGRFAHVRVRGDEVTWMYLVQGSLLRFRGETLEAAEGDFSHRGEVLAVERREAGFAQDVFVLDSPLPGPASRWVGKTLLVTGGDGWTWAYRIERVEGERVVTSDEPGFELDADGIDRQYFPLQEHLGLERIPGPVVFLAAGSALRGPDGAIRTTRDATSPPGTDAGTGSDGGAAGADGALGAGADGGAPLDADRTVVGCGCRVPAGSRGLPVLVWLLVLPLGTIGLRLNRGRSFSSSRRPGSARSSR